MNKTISLLTMLVLVFTTALPAQSLRRAVIAGAGGSLSDPAGTVRLSSTVAQPPGTGTLYNGAYYLRQGFQQPAGCATAPQAMFTIQPEGDPLCGGPYQMVYLDEPQETTLFRWDFGDGAQPVDTSSVMNPDGIHYLAPGEQTIQLIVSTEKCIDTAYMTLDVQAAPLDVVENRLDLLCREDEDGAVGLFITGGTEPYEVNWSTGESGVNISGLLPGEYDYDLTDANGCTFSDTVLINGPEAIELDVEIIPESCFGNVDGRIEVSVSGGTPPYEFTWSNGQTERVMRNAAAGDYGLIVRDGNNCEQTFEFTVTADCNELRFYEVFTPNGDGQNDTWWVDGISIFPDNELEIYDRWGKLVFRQVNYNNSWEGTEGNGTILPEGVYFYILRLTDGSGTRYSGSITLLR